MNAIGKLTLIVLLAALLWQSAVISGAQADNGSVAENTFHLTLDAPITTWDEAIPLGNGMLGGLLWGTDNTVNLSLDRGDLWDETTPPEIQEGNWNYANMKQLIKENFGEFMRRYDGTYNHPAPTKLPGGRLVLTLSPANQAQSFTLDMKRARGIVTFRDGGALECFFHATERVALIRVDDTNVTSKFIRPDGLDQLNYQPAQFGQDDDASWMVQEASEGLVYATLTATRRVGNQTFLAVAITTNREDADQSDPLTLARSRIARALDSGFDQMFRGHSQWWDRFWAQSEVTVPDQRIQRHYNLVKYFYGAASRPDAPSMPLQAVWTQDSGGLPPWKGDFHHDLNTQMTYLAYHTAGLVDSGMSFINHMWDLMPEYRKFSQEFFGVEGAAVPTVMTLHGKPLGGWPQYTLSPTYAIWIGQSFYLHWKYTMDGEFLRQKAYPWMDEIVNAIVQLLEEKDGKLYLPLSSSSEIFDASPRAFLQPNSNQDLAMLQWAFDAMAEMAAALGKESDVARWRALRSKLDELHVDDNVLMFSANEPFNQSHRHHAHAMAIHPLATLNIDGTEKDRQVIQATLQKMDELGTQAWTGYSFSWFACLLARAGQSELAFQYLTYYERAFILRNGFHVNGDQIGTGLSGFSYRPFTLEGNFLAMEAVHDMVLQSWPVNIAQDPTPVIRLFPAMPWRWHQASFRDLRCEGGFVVSAARDNNTTTRFEIRATVDGQLRLRDDFGGREPAFSHQVKRDGRDFVLTMKAGETLVGTLNRPDALPSEPKESLEVGKRLQRIEELPAARALKISSTTIPLLICQLLYGQRATAADAFDDIPRVDVHAHCGTPERMAEYVQISRELKQRHGQQLVAWIDLDFLRSGSDVTADRYLQAAKEQYAWRFLPCLHDDMKDGLQYTAEDIESWQKRGVVGLKIWLGLSEAIDNRQYDPLFVKMAALEFPGASVHIAQPYPTSWCRDPVEFWRAQNAWERVLDRHPELIVVNAHMLDHFNSDEQLDYLAYVLATYPKVHVDLAARFQQFHMMDRDKLRDFVIRFQDRILFGTDISRLMGSPQEMAERYYRCFQLLETDEIVKGSFFEDQRERRGLALPRDVLEKIYYRNALRIYPRLQEDHVFSIPQPAISLAIPRTDP